MKLFKDGERERISPQLSMFRAAEGREKGDGGPASPPAPRPSSPARPVPGVAHRMHPAHPLNPQQQAAVDCTDRPLIIAAGPGTGKTRTLTARMASLVTKNGVSPENLLAVTFTNKAAQEMARRLEAFLGAESAQKILIKTFHAFGAWVLRREVSAIGMSPNFAIASEYDRSALLGEIYPKLSRRERNQLLERISEAKNRFLDPFTALPSQEDENFVEIYRRYDAALRQNHLLDFDDLIVKTVRIFDQNPERLQQYQQRFRWISVDEYQDINFAQYRMLRLLTAPETNLCVIGDPDQAIYGFRGADRSYFLQFQQDFPNARAIHLNQNYRSTQLIIDAATQVISRSAGRQQIELFSEFVSQTKLEIYHAQTEKAEAEFVTHEIEKMVGGTSYFSLDSGRVGGDETGLRSFSDFAVLFRAAALAPPLIEAFQRAGFPYQSTAGVSLFETREVRSILPYLWVLFNPEARFFQQGVRDVGLLDGIAGAAPTRPVAQLIAQISEHLFPHPDEKGAEKLRKLIGLAEPFDTRLKDFLEYTSLQKEADAYDPRADRIALMTLHAAKGLEFPVVFIVSCEENIIPYQKDGQISDLEEERRLFYVGMTRAQEKLVLTRAKKRFLFGQTVRYPPSRFVSDIEAALVELRETEKKAHPKRKKDSQMRLF